MVDSPYLQVLTVPTGDADPGSNVAPESPLGKRKRFVRAANNEVRHDDAERRD